MDSKIDKYKKEFLDDLISFFNEINDKNFFKDESYEKITEILRKYVVLIGNKDIVIEQYEKSYNSLELDQWQEDVYYDVCDRLTGFSAPKKRIEL